MESSQRNSQELVDQEQAPAMDSSGTESAPTEWTDEKHSLYLKSIEASFVNQLYNALDFPGLHTSGSNSSFSRKLSTSTSGQFKVHQDGSWHEINFKRPDPRLNKADDSDCILTSPWVRHFRSASKTQECGAAILKEKKAASGTSAANLKPYSSLRWPSKPHKVTGEDTSPLEVSDQNFVDEAVEGFASGKGCNYGTKRMRTSQNGISTSTDQVVPLSKGPLTEDVPNAHTSSTGR